MAERRLKIAIDGPSGSGKSTLGKELARRLGLPYLDTGAMYRAVAWKAIAAGAGDEGRIVDLLADLDLEVDTDPDGFRVRVDGEDVTESLREPAVGRVASVVAALPAVRAWLVPRQAELAAAGGVVEGRDIGTVVLPDADCKFFVVAGEAERIWRRAAQLGRDPREAVVEDVRERDRRDRTRRTSPLRRAPDAVWIDTSGQTIEESVERMLAAIRRGTGDVAVDDADRGRHESE